MKVFSEINKISIKNLMLGGWMLDYLKLQESGLTGNLDQCGYPFDSYGWYDFDLNCFDEETDETDVLTKNGKSCPHWWPYEQTAYFLDGMERCGQLLHSDKLLKKSEKSFKFTLENQDSDGFIGPRFLKNNAKWNKWPGVVFLRALLARYYATGDKKIIESIKRYYLDSNIDFSNGRDVFNVEIMLLVYLENGDLKLLERAIDTYKKYNDTHTGDTCDKVALSDKIPYEHGVTYNEYSKLGALLYICTGEENYLSASKCAYKKIDKYFMLASGLHCSNEYLRSNHYMQSHEACDVSDYTWSLYYLLMATGDSAYADKIEKCVLNAGIGCLTEDFRALQYFSCPNQLISDSTSNHNSYKKGSNWMTFRPNHVTECCPGNITRFFPNYCNNMWMKKQNTLFSIFFGECSLKEQLDNNNYIEISQNTNYPFEESVKYIVKYADCPFDLKIRIPKWSTNTFINVNGKYIKYKCQKGFAVINDVKSDDVICVEFHSIIKINNNGQKGCVVSKGPLVYCFGMYGNRQYDCEGKYPKDFPVYSIYPDKKWNYGLISKCREDYKFVKNNISGNPWDIRYTPLRIIAKAKKISYWDLQKCSKVYETGREIGIKPPPGQWVKRECVLTPPLPTNKQIINSKQNPVEYIELVPLAAAKLRLTVFPKMY